MGRKPPGVQNPISKRECFPGFVGEPVLYHEMIRLLKSSFGPFFFGYNQICQLLNRWNKSCKGKVGTKFTDMG